MAFAIQPDEYSCGPTCVFNALLLLGNADIRMGRIKRACGTRPNTGTSENGLQRGLRRLGYEGVEASWNRKSHGRKALAWLREEHSLGHPVIICVDQYEHWVLVAGSTQRSYFILDPKGNRQRAAASSAPGTVLLQRWWGRDRVTNSGSYYAISVRPRTQKATVLAQHALPLTNRDVLERIRESAVDLLPVSNSLLNTFGSVKNGKKLEGLLEEIAPRLANRKELLHAGLDDSDIDEQVRNFTAFARGKQLQYRPAQRERAVIDLTALLLLHTYQAQEAHV
jgi:hypothetical protein